MNDAQRADLRALRIAESYDDLEHVPIRTLLGGCRGALERLRVTLRRNDVVHVAATAAVAAFLEEVETRVSLFLAAERYDDEILAALERGEGGWRLAAGRTSADERWHDDAIQFPRLLAEIRATQSLFNWEDLAASMDLEVSEIELLFDRADVAWEAQKEAVTAVAIESTQFMPDDLPRSFVERRPLRLDEYPVVGSVVEVDPTGRDLDYEPATIEGYGEDGYTVRLQRTGERIGAVTRYRIGGKGGKIVVTGEQS
jgi:hypothetical protein